MTDKPDEEPKQKIIIDEDWKSQVEAEKESLQQQAQQGEPQEETSSNAEPDGPPPNVTLPPATFEVLIASLGMQALIGMGMMPNPADGKTEPHLDHAKHLIDTLGMLEAKTEGNRTREETEALSNLLHELRLAYVRAAGAPAQD